MSGTRRYGRPGRPTTAQYWSAHPEVQAFLDPSVDNAPGEGDAPGVQLILSHKAARQLQIALGMNGRRYGPHVQAVTEALSMLTIGVIAGEETAHHRKEDTDG